MDCVSQASACAFCLRSDRLLIIAVYAAELVSQYVEVAFQRVVVQALRVGEQYLDGQQPRGVCGQCDRPGCVATWGAAFPPSLREFATYEARAITLWTFEHSVMPGLLQTENYARSVLERHPNVTPDQVAERVAGRLARQAVLDRDDLPLFWVLLDENVLHREIGDAKIMRDQLAHLAGMARRPNITVQVIPRIGPTSAYPERS
jgi:hypothetical protein